MTATRSTDAAYPSVRVDVNLTLEGECFRADTRYGAHQEIVEIDTLAVTFHENGAANYQGQGHLIRKDGTVGRARRTYLPLRPGDVPPELRRRITSYAHLAATRLASNLYDATRVLEARS